jgi:tetratricopeptide (TPR) repeat protein
MKLSRTGLGLLAVIALISTSGCSYINRIRAKNELNQVAQNYKDKKFVEAEQHARKAVELDPDNENAPLFLARTIHAQFRRGDTTPENLAKAKDAIDAYQKIAARDPNNDEAFSAVTILLGQLHPEEQTKCDFDSTGELVKWVEARANNEAVSPEKRSDAFAILSDKDWQCSINVTDANKQSVQKPDGSVFIQYTKPKDTKQYDDAVKFMTRGLERAEKAISINPNSEKAWGQKYKLLQEAKKLALMADDKDKAAQYAKQAEEAANKSGELRRQATPSPSATPPST